MKRKYLIFTVLSALLLFSCANNKIIDIRVDKQQVDSALLQIPIEIDVIHLNQRAIKLLPSYQKIVTYRLPPGKQTIGLQYKDMLTNEDGEQESIKSHAVQIVFDAEKNQSYRIKFDPPKSFESAQKLTENLNLALYHQNDLLATSTVNDLWGAYNISTDLENTNDLQKPADNASAGEHLMYWWRTASEADRQLFLQQIQTSANQQ